MSSRQLPSQASLLQRIVSLDGRTTELPPLLPLTVKAAMDTVVSQLPRIVYTQEGRNYAFAVFFNLIFHTSSMFAYTLHSSPKYYNRYAIIN